MTAPEVTVEPEATCACPLAPIWALIRMYGRPLAAPFTVATLVHVPVPLGLVGAGFVRSELSPTQTPRSPLNASVPPVMVVNVVPVAVNEFRTFDASDNVGALPPGQQA